MRLTFAIVGERASPPPVPVEGSGQDEEEVGSKSLLDGVLQRTRGEDRQIVADCSIEGPLPYPLVPVQGVG